jgi:polysaccharide biosynthesis transport protein
MVTGLNCIGMLPGLGRARRARARNSSTADVNSRILSTQPDILRHVLEQPKSRYSEEIRALSLRVSRGNQRAMPTNLIGCVSAQHGEGTSTVAANLAQSLAKAGNRTLLVDWASDAGSLSHLLSPNAKKGFLDLLAGSAKLEDLVWSDPDTGLHFLPSGSRPPRVITSLINGPQAQDARAELLGHYEYVVFDVPALSPPGEMHAAAQLLDAFVLVVAWGRADPDQTLGALTGAELDDRRFLGAVFNGVDFKSHQMNPGSRADRPIAALT